MMHKAEDKDTRYFIEVDLKTRKILRWSCGPRRELAGQKPGGPFHHRVYITKGQYNKIEKMSRELTPRRR